MSNATPSRPSADRKLLVDILALQMDFITRDALIAAMHAWVLDQNQIIHWKPSLHLRRQTMFVYPNLL
jgi:hypothetical protein